VSARGDELANAAQALVGVPFRLHGREPATGLDCLGLVGRALEDCGRSVRYPQGYRLRNTDIAPWLGFAARNGLRSCADPVRRGDVLLMQPGPAQHHLLIALGDTRFVHAHAGLRRVVIQHFPSPQPPLAQWRLDPDPEQIWQR
jgi:cell wall-associated NlpC family hydrolase